MTITLLLKVLAPLLDEMSKSSNPDELERNLDPKKLSLINILEIQNHIIKVRQLVDMFREYYVNIALNEIDARKTDQSNKV